MHRPIDCDNPGGDLYLMAAMVARAITEEQ